MTTKRAGKAPKPLDPPEPEPFEFTITQKGRDSETYLLDPEPDARVLDFIRHGFHMAAMEHALVDVDDGPTAAEEYDRFRSTKIKLDLRMLNAEFRRYFNAVAGGMEDGGNS